MGYIRHILTSFGGAMVAKGEITADQNTAILGGVLALVGLIWSHLSKTTISLNDQASDTIK